MQNKESIWFLYTKRELDYTKLKIEAYLLNTMIKRIYSALAVLALLQTL